MIRSLKDNYKYYIFCLIFIIINVLFLNNIYLTNENIHLDKNYFIILGLSILFEVIISIILLKFKNMKAENIFLLLSTPIGILYLFLIPLGLVPDEYAHFARTYEIASGNLISDVDENGIGGRILPVEIYEDLASNTDFKYNQIITNLKDENNTYEYLRFSNTSLYSFACYIPQTIGVMLGKILNLPIIIIGYLGRIMNFITWTILMYFSIKYIPFLKNFIMFVALMPIVLQEAISLSSDSLTIGVAVALFSYIMYTVYSKKEKLKKNDYIILTILVVLMSLCKIVYLPLCLLLFLIPVDKFKNKKDKYIKIGLLAFLVILINLIWLKIASRYLVEFQEGVNSFEQVKFILSNPFMYIQTFFNSWVQNSSFYLFTMVGKGLEWFNIDLPYIYPLITIGILIILIYKQNFSKYEVKVSNKMLILFIILSTIILMFTSLYVQWTPVGNEVINGVQGRYFIPILFMVPFLFMRTTKDIKIKDNNNLYLYSYILFQNIYVLMVIFFNHL